MRGLHGMDAAVAPAGLVDRYQRAGMRQHLPPFWRKISGCALFRHNIAGDDNIVVSGQRAGLGLGRFQAAYPGDVYKRQAHVVEGLIIFRMQSDYVFHNLEGFLLVAGLVQQRSQKKGHLRTVGPFFGGPARHLKGLRQLLLACQQADFQLPELGRVRKLFLGLPRRGQGLLFLARFAKQLYPQQDVYKRQVQ